MRERGKRSHTGASPAPPRPALGAYPSRARGPILPGASRARVAELVDAADSDNNLSPRARNPRGEARQTRRRPSAIRFRADAEPSLRKREGRCREQTAGTYSLEGHGEGVLQTTNPSGCCARGGESRSGRKIRRP